MKPLKTILVTGGAGFIGSHLCEALLARGLRVICLDNFCSFYSPQVKRKNLEACLQHPEFTLVEADICDYAALDAALSEHKPTMVVHLAAMAGVQPSIADPQTCIRVNLNGTVNLLQLCARHCLTKFIFASSSSVYGNSPAVPFSESDPVDNPISPYAATKKAGELLCHTWHHLWGISMLCLRFFTVYGPRQRPDLAIHKFMNLMQAGEPLPVYGDGSSSRDYTYIGDIICGILNAMDFVERNHCFEVINLGSDRTICLAEMIRTLEQVSGLTARQDVREAMEGDVLQTHADIRKARRLLGYEPKQDFETGLREFWQWWKAQPTP